MSSPEAAKRLAQHQFGRAAAAYVSSAILAEGEELARLVEVARLGGGERVLDIATGGGHTALAFAPHVREVVATDLTPRMLEAAVAHLRGRGAGNVRFEVADAEALPHRDGEFDVVSTRYAPHHFPAPAAFAGEAARVLRPGGRLVMFDNMAPEDGRLDRFMNRFERWRDPSHIRARRSSQWQALLAAAGLVVEVADPLVHRVYPFGDWTGRMHLPEPERDALERWLLAAPAACARFFAIERSGGRVVSLEATFGLIAARRPPSLPS